MLKRITSIILSIVLVASVCPVYSTADTSDASGMDGSLNMFDIERTTYGVLDPDVVATKFVDGDDYEIVFPNYFESVVNSYETYGTPCVIIREAYDGELHKYYLISSKRIVQTYIADEEPELVRISADDAPYSIYRVYNSETKLYDVYNATTDTYYAYGFNSIFEAESYDAYDYWDDFYEVSKDEKYGILGKKGEILYEPYYYDIGYLTNCAIGCVKVNDSDYYHTDYALLANDGNTNGKLLHPSFVCDVNDVLYATKQGDYGPYALVDQNSLKVYTDYIYSDITIREVDGKQYLMCTARYKSDPEQSNNYYYQDIVSSDGVWNSLAETGDESTFIEWEEGYDTFKLEYYTGESEIKTKNYRIYKADGTLIYTNALTEMYPKDPEYDNNVGYLNGSKVMKEYNKDHDEYSIYNSSNQLIAENLAEPGIYGDYIYSADRNTNKFLIYNSANGEILFSDVSILNNDTSSYGIKKFKYTGVMFIENAEGMRGILNLDNGEFSGFIYSSEDLNGIYDSILESKGRKLWIFADSDGNSVYVNEDFKIISRKGLTKSGDYFIQFDDAVSFYESAPARIIDYDGKTVVEFDHKQHFHIGYYDDENGLAEGWLAYDNESKKEGLITADGKLVLDSLYGYVGRTVNGLTLVCDTNDDYFSIVDNNGNALIYGEFYKPSSSSDPSYSIDYTGFVALPRQENGKEVVYLYDFSKCLGTVSDVELPSEDILFGEYNSYLNNRFYGSMADNITEIIANAVAANTAHSAKVVALAKSGLSGGLEYAVKKLLSFIPSTELSEERVCQDLALQYLENLEADEVESYIEDISKTYEFAEKINEYYEQIGNLSSEANKLKFCNLWVSDQFSQTDVYELVTEAEKKTDYIRGFGKAMTVAEYVMTYMMIRSIENGVVKRLMELVPSNSALYKGLDYIYKQQTGNNVAVFAAEFLSSEMIGKIADFAQEGLIKVFTTKNVSLISFIINTSMKLIATQIDSPTLEDIDKAVLALANAQTLAAAAEDYRELIAYNYEKKGALSIEQMKFDYSILMKAYFKSLIVGLECAKNLADEDELAKYEMFISQYELKLLYRSYISSCLVNATAMWEYTVEANKAVLSKLKAQFPKGEGRIPLYDLVFSDKYNEDDFYSNIGSSCQYAIDIPSEIDGYEVSSVSGILSTSESKLNGVYIPSGIESIDGTSFENCTGIDTVFADNDTVIPENTFTEDIVSTRDKEIAEIKIATAADVTEMNMQDDIDDTGLTLEVTYVDGTTEVVSEGFYCNIEERVNGQNTVVVNYKGSITEYPVTIRESDCEYTVKYVDEYGNVLKETVVGTAKSGSTLTVNAENIDGYTAVESGISEVIGFENDFVITYRENGNVSIQDVEVSVEDQEFTGKEIRPEITVVIDGKTLTEGTDYTVVFENNIMSGTATAIIFGCGNYTGIVAAEFEITGGVSYGDVSVDGVINASDALRILETAAKLKTLTNEQMLAGDVNGDNVINAADALLILQYAARLINVFPVEK